MNEEKEKEYIKDKIEIILAIETLEYHNCNYLAGDNKSRNEVKRSHLLEIISLLGATAYDKIEEAMGRIEVATKN